jgi:hypothetical protein
MVMEVSEAMKAIDNAFPGAIEKELNGQLPK